MVQSDYDLLTEMGFEPHLAALATKKTKSLQDAIDWLDQNSGKPAEELSITGEAEGESSRSNHPAGSARDEDGDQAEEDGAAASLKCSDCGKLFSTPERAQFHATRSEHQNFEESTETIRPLTEEEKMVKLAELRQRLAEKRATQAAADREEQKKNETIRRKKAKESEDLKEQLQKKEQLKEAEQKKREKIEDAKAKEKVLQQIRDTQEARRMQAERDRAAREGRTIQEEQPKLSTPKATTTHSESRLQLRLPSGQPLVKTFAADATLFEVASAIEAERGFAVSSFTMTFPRKVFQNGIDFGLSLREAGMVPSCALIVS